MFEPQTGHYSRLTCLLLNHHYLYVRSVVQGSRTHMFISHFLVSLRLYVNIYFFSYISLCSHIHSIPLQSLQTCLFLCNNIYCISISSFDLFSSYTFQSLPKMLSLYIKIYFFIFLYPPISIIYFSVSKNIYFYVTKITCFLSPL